MDPAPPLVGAATDGYVAASVPLLGAPSLADSSAEAFDGCSLSFLLQRALEEKRKEEEEAAVEAAEMVELEEMAAAAERRLLEEVAWERVEAVRITPQSWSTLSRIDRAAVLWFVAKEKVDKRKAKRKRKRKRKKSTRRRRCPWSCSRFLRVFLSSLSTFLQAVFLYGLRRRGGLHGDAGLTGRMSSSMGTSAGVHTSCSPQVLFPDRVEDVPVCF